MSSCHEFFWSRLIAQRNEATRGSVRAEFVLGAMLPDFASMLRTRPPRDLDAGVQAGLSFHHQTDDAFHGSPRFLEFSGQAPTLPERRAVCRAGARAPSLTSGSSCCWTQRLPARMRANEAYLSASHAH